MAALPYMQLYVAEYLADTAHLRAAEHGAYLLLLMNYWQRGKPLIDADDRLASVARMSNEDWNWCRPIIAEFFEVRDGLWFHKRVERDLAKVNGVCESARRAGIASAKARNKDTLNDRSTTAEQPPERALNHTDTYTDKEQIKKQKPSRAKKLREVRNAPPCKTDIYKARHKEFKAVIGLYWLSKNPNVEMPWGAAEGKNLGMWLQESPNTTIDQFRAYLKNRFRSDVNHTERPSSWIRRVTDYATGPLDRFSKPQILNGGSNGTKPTYTQPNAALVAIKDRERKVREEREEGTIQ